MRGRFTQRYIGSEVLQFLRIFGPARDRKRRRFGPSGGAGPLDFRNSNRH
jgi:hypothetical protein